MMAFFLLLWLLSVTTASQKVMIASYFAPTDARVSDSMSGSGGVLGGTTVAADGSMTSNGGQPADATSNGTEDDNKSQKADEATNTQDEKNFKSVEDKIREALESDPALKDLAKNLLMDMTPEGLRIQLIDQDGTPMSRSGSATPLPQAVKLLNLIASVAKDLPNKTSIRGHTDSVPYGKGADYTNWELSSDRANASRRVLLAAGFGMERVENVMGKADRDPLLPKDPAAASNRRISIIFLKQSLVAGARRAEDKFKKQEKEKEKGLGFNKAPPEPRTKEEGVRYFP